MKIPSNRNTYGEVGIRKEQKQILKTSVFICLFFLCVCITLVIIFPENYSIIIGYVVGALASGTMFYYLAKNILETPPSGLAKVTRRIHLLFGLAYFILFLLIYYLFKNYFALISLLVGLITIRLGILLTKVR